MCSQKILLGEQGFQYKIGNLQIKMLMGKNYVLGM